MIYSEILQALENYIYKKENIVILALDEVSNNCGYFTDEIGRNYGCDHPDCEDRDGPDGAGRCFTFSCPIAWEADMEDLRKYDIEEFNFWFEELTEEDKKLDNLEEIRPWDGGFGGDDLMCASKISIGDIL